jgi:general secretion pathway protein J
MALQAGFSLVEMMVSLLILGMLATMLLSGVHTGRRVWQDVNTRAGNGDTFSSARMLMTQMLGQSFPSTRYDASSPYAYFTGNQTSIRFQGPANSMIQPGDIRDQYLFLSNKGKLLLASKSLYALDNSLPGQVRQTPQTLTLMENVQSLEIDYFGAAAPDRKLRWRTLWYGQPALPALVRIRLTFSAGDERRWPDLVIHPETDIDKDCQYNAQLLRCTGR